MYRPVGHTRFAPPTVAALAASALALSVVPGVADADDSDDAKNDVAQDQGKQEEGSSQGAKIAAGVAGSLGVILAIAAAAYQAGLLPNIPGLPKFF